MKEKRKAREIALTFLYQWDVRGDEVLPEMDEVLIRDRRPADVSDHVRQLVRGAAAEHEAIDLLLSEAAEHWRVPRMAVVDRNILRMAVWEMQQGDVPVKVVINEAIELGKRFGSKQSGAFVNGVLDRVRKNLGL